MKLLNCASLGENKDVKIRHILSPKSLQFRSNITNVCNHGSCVCMRHQVYTCATHIMGMVEQVLSYAEKRDVVRFATMQFAINIVS